MLFINFAVILVKKETLSFTLSGFNKMCLLLILSMILLCFFNKSWNRLTLFKAEHIWGLNSPDFKRLGFCWEVMIRKMLRHKMLRPQSLSEESKMRCANGSL